MKKLVVLMAAAGFGLSAMAEVVTLTHSEAGALASELSECGVDVASITELAITGDAEMTAADFEAIRSSMSKTLQKLDLSQALFANNTLPSTNVKTAGVLNNMAITECILPESLTALGDGAFVKCTKLKKVNVPEGVKIIPQYCFSNCLELSDITLSESIVRIQDFAFEKCSKLPFEELPPYLLSIGQKAFNATNVAFSRLPETLTGNGLGQLCFANTKVSFTEIPAGMTALKEGIFLGTKVNFTSLPEQITLAEKRVFENVRTLTYFEITDVAGLSTTIPPSFFYIANDDVERTFVCRSMTPPAATVSTTDATGSFGKVAEFKNTTFRVPLGALAAYAEVEPYSTMNLLPISVKVTAPEVEMPYNVAPEHIKVAYVVGDIEHSDFDKEVCEGEGKLVVSFADEADDYLYVSEIHGKKAVAAMAEGEDDKDAMTLLYACEEAKDKLKAQVEIPVTVNDAMDTHHIVISRYSEPSMINDVAADTSYSRRGDVLEFSAAGARLFDMTGVCVRRADGPTMSLTGLPAGVYVVSVGTEYIKILK